MAEFKVRITAGKRPIWRKVEADYGRIGDHGELVFRNRAIGNQYPYMVHTFAAGTWSEIVQVFKEAA